MDTIELVDNSIFEKSLAILNLSIKVNGKLLHDILDANDPFNELEFVESCIRPGAYFLFTCGCGDPGCAGMFTPAKIGHNSGAVNWIITEIYRDRKFEKPRTFTFRKDEYVGVGRKIVELAGRALESGVITRRPGEKERYEWIFNRGYALLKPNSDENISL